MDFTVGVLLGTFLLSIVALFIFIWSMSTGLFFSYRLSRLLDHEHADSEIYTIQYLVRDRASWLRYSEEFQPALQKAHRDRYAGRFAAFRTLMEVVDHNEKI